MFDSTVGLSTSNSYVSVEYADAFFAASINSSGWPTVELQKEAALQEATRVLDEQFSWIGQIATETQALAWPRSGAVDPEGRPIAVDAIPKRVADATCSLALFLIQNGGVSKSGMNVKGLKVGPIDLKFESNETIVGTPPYIVQMLSKFGYYNGYTLSGVRSVDVIRC